MHQFFKFIFEMEFYMFRTVPLSIVRSFSLYTQQWYMSYSLRAGSGRNCSSVLILLTPDDGQRNCPKICKVSFQNKFEKLVHLVGFIIRMSLDLDERVSLSSHSVHVSYIGSSYLFVEYKIVRTRFRWPGLYGCVWGPYFWQKIKVTIYE